MHGLGEDPADALSPKDADSASRSSSRVSGLAEAFEVESKQPLKKRRCMRIWKRGGMAANPQRSTGRQPQTARLPPVSFPGRYAAK